MRQGFSYHVNSVLTQLIKVACSTDIHLESSAYTPPPYLCAELFLKLLDLLRHTVAFFSYTRPPFCAE